MENYVGQRPAGTTYSNRLWDGQLQGEKIFVALQHEWVSIKMLFFSPVWRICRNAVTDDTAAVFVDT